VPSTVTEHLTQQSQKLPPWFKQEIPNPEASGWMRALLDEFRLTTVCEHAHCPNIGQCWEARIATFQILGEVCTRNCRFCAVASGDPVGVDQDEPKHVAQAVRKLDLRYVVITSVTRDDLPDGGAEQFIQTVGWLQRISPLTKVELLIPDFAGNFQSLDQVIETQPDVLGHNIETVRRLVPTVQPQADYERSLKILRRIKERGQKVLVKSGFMVGLGESDEEVQETLTDLRDSGCDILTIGQYLSPAQSARHLPVARFVPPGKFVEYQKLGLSLGLRFVKSAPLVRSSFLAEEGYRSCRNEKKASCYENE
jgi:lipoyl synthase